MDKKIRLGIPFDYNSGWIAGVYYIANLIEGLNLLNDEKKPHVFIYFDQVKSIRVLRDIRYPYISFIKRKPIIKTLCNKISRRLLRRNIFERKLSPDRIDVLFPVRDNYFFDLIPLSKRMYWIQDFQEHFLPEFFSKEDIAYRKKKQQKLVDVKANILFSSKSSESDFFTIYPDAQNKTYVLPFAVSNGVDYKKLRVEELLRKFNLPGEYFFCANQVWAHKNHITVLKALSLLKKKGKNLIIAFSGNKTDYRNAKFFEDLLKYVADHKLEDNTRFLGFIDRNEQLALMRNSLAIIQPSLFEGWSTVVEDAKSLNKCLVISDITIHREQTDKNVFFFDPFDDKKQPFLKISSAILRNTITLKTGCNLLTTFIQFWPRPQARIENSRLFVDIFYLF